MSVSLRLPPRWLRTGDCCQRIRSLVPATPPPGQLEDSTHLEPHTDHPAAGLQTQPHRGQNLPSFLTYNGDSHIASQRGPLKHDAGEVAPGAAQVRRAGALDGRAVDDIPERVIARAARGGNIPVSNRLRPHAKPVSTHTRATEGRKTPPPCRIRTGTYVDNRAGDPYAAGLGRRRRREMRNGICWECARACASAVSTKVKLSEAGLTRLSCQRSRDDTA